MEKVTYLELFVNVAIRTHHKTYMRGSRVEANSDKNIWAANKYDVIRILL